MITYALNIRAPKNVKQILTELEGEIDSSVVITEVNAYERVLVHSLACSRYSKVFGE